MSSIARDAVLVETTTSLEGTHERVRGFDFDSALGNDGRVDYDALFAAYKHTGFQASNLGSAIDIVNQMLRWRLSDEPVADDEDEELRSAEARSKVKCTIFLGFTSNMISCGMREIIRFLVKHKMVSCIVTTGGGIEEDFLKCLAPHYMGDFYLKGRELRKKGINRIGNLLVPNDNYCKFEDWLVPILRTMHDEQDRDNIVWSPSSIIRRLGKEIDNEESVYYWCYKNDIPVFCPAITDGSIGDMMYFESYKRPGFICDIVGDIRKLNDIALTAKRTGMLILGGGLVKHHICNANLMRNGANYSVFINTASDFDGSDSGARPDEAISWGKIRLDGLYTKVCGEASLLFPLLVSQTFVKEAARRKREEDLDAKK